MTNPINSGLANDLDALLAPFERSNDARYRSASWLGCDFYDPTWIINSDTQFQIDWRVHLYDGSLLTSNKNQQLCESFRSWPIARTHVDTTGGKLYSPRSERNIIQHTLHCIDYMLMHAESLQLVEHGLSGLSENDLRSILAAIASNRSVCTSVYEWPKKLSSFLRKRISTLPQTAYDDAKEICRDIGCDIPSEADRLTDLDDDEVLLARSWLVLNGAYKPGTNGFRLAPKLTDAVDALYRGTLFGSKIVLPVAAELCIGPSYYVRTEYPRARVTSPKDERMEGLRLNNYVRAISVMPLLRLSNLDAPNFSVDNLRNFACSLDTKPNGRYRTLPQHVVFPALRSGVEFALEYGESLIDCYLNIARAATKAGEPIGLFAERIGDISSFVPDPCKRLGVTRWTIESGGAKNSPILDYLNADDWYSALRSNIGLYESLLVLFGAIQISIGTLMARRHGELLDLTALDCLDTSETRLVFRNRKSGPAGLRELEARPIPPIGVRLIKLLERLQLGLIEMGAMDGPTNLFSLPTKYKRSCLAISTKTQSFRVLDLFCDWCQSPLDAEGNRYYIRQHQLRRFFAMLFFWGGGFGGMDTLRWFLGHTDLQHLWNYITESIPGITIRTVAAEWAVYSLKHATKEAELLSGELAEHFGTSDFSVLDEDALVMHIEDLMEEGRLSIEPEFLDNGRSYRIAVILKPKALS